MRKITLKKQVSRKSSPWIILLLVLVALVSPASGQTRQPFTGFDKEVESALEQAATFYKSLSVQGGFVYYYSLDGRRRLGEGAATPTQIWVQPPGTPTVGEAFLDAYEATGNPNFLQQARSAGLALAYGQLKSGGWTNLIDFDPKSKSAGLYRNGRGKGKNNTSLDDDQTCSALRLLIRLDKALEHRDSRISDCLEIGLESLLNAQFPNGAFPQVWTKPVKNQAITSAKYPEYDWKTENRIKNYWDLYTINDNVTGSVARTLIAAHQSIGDKVYLDCLNKLGEFLIRAQMPDPQPGWAQQYDYQMRPVWARRFEPPAVCSDETQETIYTLMLISAYTESDKFLIPIPRALNWLEKCKLPSGDFARYYELQTNRPLYMNRNGKIYYLTYSDKNLPSHYGWKIKNRIDNIKSIHLQTRSGIIRFAELLEMIDGSYSASRQEVRNIIDSLDAEGRWVSRYQGQRLVGQPKFPKNEEFISSQVFADNLRRLSGYLKSQRY